MHLSLCLFPKAFRFDPDISEMLSAFVVKKNKDICCRSRIKRGEYIKSATYPLKIKKKTRCQSNLQNALALEKEPRLSCGNEKAQRDSLGKRR